MLDFDGTHFAGEGPHDNFEDDFCLLLHPIGYTRWKEWLSYSYRLLVWSIREAIVSLTWTVRIVIATVSKETERWWKRSPRFSKPKRRRNSLSTRHMPRKRPRALVMRQKEREKPSIDQGETSYLWMCLHRRQRSPISACDTEPKNGSGSFGVYQASRRRIKVHEVLRECPSRIIREGRPTKQPIEPVAVL